MKAIAVSLFKKISLLGFLFSLFIILYSLNTLMATTAAENAKSVGGIISEKVQESDPPKEIAVNNVEPIFMENITDIKDDSLGESSENITGNAERGDSKGAAPITFDRDQILRDEGWRSDEERVDQRQKANGE